MAMTGGTVGKSFLIEDLTEKMYVNQRVACIRCIDSTVHYIYYIINSAYIKDIINSNKTSTNDNISMKDISNFLIPIPPFNEQIKIVDKLNELMDYINKYGVLEEELTILNDNFPELIKKSILQEAFQGKLVPQDSSDEPASVLLDRIREEKEQLVKNKKIKRNNKESFIFKENNHFYEKIGKNGEPVCIDDEIPFDIPENWEWCRLNSLAQINMGQSPKSEFINEHKNGLEFHQGKLFFGKKYLKKSNKNTVKYSKIAPPNSILLCVRAPVGVINICNRKIAIGRGLASINPYISCIFDYLYYLLLTYESQFKKKSTGSTFKAIKKGIIEDELIPLPPLKEQKKIIIIIEEIFDKLML